MGRSTPDDVTTADPRFRMGATSRSQNVGARPNIAAKQHNAQVAFHPAATSAWVASRGNLSERLAALVFLSPSSTLAREKRVPVLAECFSLRCRAGKPHLRSDLRIRTWVAATAFFRPCSEFFRAFREHVGLLHPLSALLVDKRQTRVVTLD